MSSLINLNKTCSEYSLAPTDDLIRFWRSKVKVTASCRGCKGIRIDVSWSLYSGLSYAFKLVKLPVFVLHIDITLSACIVSWIITPFSDDDDDVRWLVRTRRLIVSFCRCLIRRIQQHRNFCRSELFCHVRHCLYVHFEMLYVRWLAWSTL